MNIPHLFVFEDLKSSQKGGMNSLFLRFKVPMLLPNLYSLPLYNMKPNSPGDHKNSLTALITKVILEF
jgi:hypothetical protein